MRDNAAGRRQSLHGFETLKATGCWQRCGSDRKASVSECNQRHVGFLHWVLQPTTHFPPLEFSHPTRGPQGKNA